MKKSKKKQKAAGKTKKKKTSKSKKEKSPAEVRQDISKVVKEHAMDLAQAVIEEGEKGQLAPARYLLELAGVFPVSTDGNPTEQEESLAETLFRKLNVPTTPVKLNDEDDDEVVVIPAQGEKSTAQSHMNQAVSAKVENAVGAATSANSEHPKPQSTPRTAAEAAEGALDAGEMPEGLREGIERHGENHKAFTPERTAEQRVDAGEPSGV